VPLLTPTREAVAETDAKGSRFIAHLIPAAVWDARLADLAVEHRKASHICTATRLMAEDDSILVRARDDGEPGGTAGMPILKVMAAVVRYFGGTKLGTGGLARAYGGAASEVVALASLTPWHRTARRTLKAGFAEANTLETRIAALPITVVQRTHTEDGVTLMVEGPKPVLDGLD